MAEAFGEECAVDLDVLVREEPNGDLRLVAVESASLEAAALVGQPHDGPGFRLRLADIAAIDPKVSQTKALDTARADDHGTFCHPPHLVERTGRPIRYNGSGAQADQSREPNE